MFAGWVLFTSAGGWTMGIIYVPEWVVPVVEAKERQGKRTDLTSSQKATIVKGHILQVVEEEAAMWGAAPPGILSVQREDRQLRGGRGVTVADAVADAEESPQDRGRRAPEESTMRGAMRSITAIELLGPLNEVEARHAPKVLYVQGDGGLLRSAPRVAIVGSRKASREGLALARRYAEEFARAGVVVISGLAAGVDTEAHRGAIGIGGRTVAVIGSGLDISYPASNRKLQATIAEDHLLVSQFSAGTPPIGRNFPMRNRTMALLTEATLIVEASEKSGTRHQGWEALRLGRMVFLEERVAEDSSLSWPSELIRYGAQVVSLAEADTIVGILPTVVDVDDLVLA